MFCGDDIIHFLGKSKMNEDISDKIIDFIENNANVDVNNFFVRCRKKLLSGNDIVLGTLVDLIKANLSSRVHDLYSTCPPQSIVRRFYQIAEALSDFDKYDLSKAPELLRDAVIESIDAGDRFTDLVKLLHVCFFMESVIWPGNGRFPKPSLEILTTNSYGNSPYTCVFTCDPVYCRYYAERFINSLRRTAGDIDVFALVVNPDQGSLDLLRTFEGLTIARTEYSGEWGTEFCTCARFMLANDVMRAVSAPMIFMDVDSFFPEGSDAFLSTISKQPLAYAEIDDVSPILKVTASVLGARPCRDAGNFFEFAADCMREGMTREGWLWGLDQLSLYRAVCHGLQNAWDMVKIDECLGRSKGFIGDFFNQGGHIQSLDQRKNTRTSNAFRFNGFGKDKRMLFAREHIRKEIDA